MQICEDFLVLNNIAALCDDSKFRPPKTLLHPVGSSRYSDFCVNSYPIGQRWMFSETYCSGTLHFTQQYYLHREITVEAQ